MSRRNRDRKNIGGRNSKAENPLSEMAKAYLGLFPKFSEIDADSTNIGCVIMNCLGSIVNSMGAMDGEIDLGDQLRNEVRSMNCIALKHRGFSISEIEKIQKERSFMAIDWWFRHVAAWIDLLNDISKIDAKIRARLAELSKAIGDHQKITTLDFSSPANLLANVDSTIALATPSIESDYYQSFCVSEKLVNSILNLLAKHVSKGLAVAGKVISMGPLPYATVTWLSGFCMSLMHRSAYIAACYSCIDHELSFSSEKYLSDRCKLEDLFFEKISKMGILESVFDLISRMCAVGKRPIISVRQQPWDSGRILGGAGHRPI